MTKTFKGSNLSQDQDSGILEDQDRVFVKLSLEWDLKKKERFCF